MHLEQALTFRKIFRLVSPRAGDRPAHPAAPAGTWVGAKHGMSPAAPARQCLHAPDFLFVKIFMYLLSVLTTKDYFHIFVVKIVGNTERA